MAPSRLYRNYTSDDGSDDAQPQRSSSLKRVQNSAVPTRSQRTLDSNLTASDEHPSNLGLTTDDDYEEESAESDFRFHPLDSGTAPPISPMDLKHQRRTPTSRISNVQERQTTFDSHSSTSRSPKTASRPTHRGNHEPEQTQQQALAVSRDDATNELASTSGQMPDFFSLAVFQVVLRNPAIAHQLLKIGRSRLCGEHMEFLARVNKYHVLLHEVSKAISGIYEDFFADGAPQYVNVPQVSNR